MDAEDAEGPDLEGAPTPENPDESTEPDAGFDARLRAGEVAFDASDAALLEAIDDQGSLNRAADELGRSYARAHQRLEELESEFGVLVERQRGGAGGGGSALTEEARRVLARFDRLRTAFSGVAAVEETVLSGAVVARDGELALVETPTGRVRALAPVDAGRVALSVRADAVTLHAPADAPPGGATSARNRFRGRVAGIDAGESVALVAVDMGAGDPLRALVTRDSLGRLDLAVGDEVVASFKATATRGTPVE
jgi:molybdate transport system regulatory protein